LTELEFFGLSHGLLSI